jgi:hypothetical protein
MGKFKAPGRKAKAGPNPGAVPCVVLILAGIIGLSLLFFLILKSA